MRILLDSCVWGGTLAELCSAGHDVDWAGNWPHDPGDEEIISRAYAEGRLLVTLDKDFGELAIVHGAAHCGIIRLVGFSARQQAGVCMKVLSLHNADLQARAIVTAEPGRLRIRMAED